MDEVTLYRMMKDLPDFDSYPIPFAWYAKFGIPMPEAIGPREYIESNYAMQCANDKKDLSPLVIDAPQKGGALVVVPVHAEVKVETSQRTFEMPESGVFPVVLPALNDP
jgi:hypothetical protein